MTNSSTRRVAGPLQGYKVVDFSQAAAGPFCTQHLGDFGANVIKVEPPDGDMIRGWHDKASRGLGTYFMGLNRNKRSIRLDLKTAGGIEIAQRLCACADIVVENYRPGTMDRLGLGYETVAKENSNVIYVSITAFGEEGPLRDRPGMDIILQAFGGIMGITGVEDGEPVKVGSPVADLATGYAAAMGTLAAALKRERTGKGSHVKLSMLNVVVSMLSNHTTGYLLHGTHVTRMGSAHPQLVPYQAFRTKDGEYLIIGILNESFWKKFCGALKRWDLYEDPRFTTNQERVLHRAELIVELEASIASRDVQAWEDLFEREDVPHARVNTFESLFEHPQVDIEGTVATVTHPELGPIPVIDQPVRLDGMRVTHRLAPPLLGEHSCAILHDLGYTDEAIKALADAGVF
jgi:crotonobetainyl-CoA:carnitine CoA-transferase CaiB-like acyl-CoA transferase